MRLHFVLWIVLAGLSLSVSAATKPFTVSDSITMVRLADPDVALADYGAVKFALSRNHERVAIVTRRGNLETGRNEFVLSVLSIADIRRVVNSRAAPLPSLAPLAVFETSSIWPAIDKVQWMPSSDAVAFIGRGEDGIGQVFVCELASRRVTQLTHQTKNILRFALSGDRRMLVYSAYEYPDWSERNAHGYAVRSDWVASLALIDPTGVMGEVRNFALNLETRKTIEVEMEPSRYATDIALSPSSRTAIVATFLQGIPSDWSTYDFVREYLGPEASALDNNESGRLNSGSPDNDAFGSRSDWLTQAMLIDTATGRVRRLYNAPLTPGAVLVSSRWSVDSERVVIGPTYLPIDMTVERRERDRRATTEAIAEVDVRTGLVQRVMDVPVGQRLADLDWLSDGTVVARFASRADPHPLPPVYLRKRNGEWAKQAKGNGGLSDDIRLTIAQSMNEPYELAAEDLRTGKKRVFTDLNPQLRDLTLGQVEVFRWTDRLGRDHQGGLVFPPNYDHARQYPVVLQGGGFKPDSFLIDGPPGFLQGATAARAIANADILVLQLPRHEAARSNATSAKGGECAKWEDCGESPLWMAMTEGAIDALSSRGLIDRNLVGLIGFSRVGMFVHHTLTFSRYRFAAATICDSIAATPFAYAMVYGFSPPGMLEFEDNSTMGAPFWADGIALWQARSPAFHLDQLTMPLRLELFGQGISAHWDTFAILKRMKRPVELIHLPLEVHNAQTPFGRYTSKQGNVDWFRFWLKGEEDIASEKAAQYERWRKLKSQYDRLLGTPGFGAHEH